MREWCCLLSIHRLAQQHKGCCCRFVREGSVVCYQSRGDKVCCCRLYRKLVPSANQIPYGKTSVCYPLYWVLYTYIENDSRSKVL